MAKDTSTAASTAKQTLANPEKDTPKAGPTSLDGGRRGAKRK